MAGSFHWFAFMVNIFAAHIDDSRNNSFCKACSTLLPATMRKQMESYRHLQDRQRYCMGKLLLLEGIKHLGYHDLTLNQVLFSDYNKPYFNNSLHFNISHSGNYTVCAISEVCRVGIDIEQVKDIDILSYKSCWSEKEWQSIIQSAFPLRSFYNFWTKKEAVIKADGKGLSIPLNRFEVLGRQTVIDRQPWFFHELHVSDEYALHVATERPLQDHLTIRYLHF